ncbi:DNA topoisomerase IA [Cyclonatronum proteinivorum]|uniref:DNA topoisomerase IA n=1 Tax=Cyclonatronum proteinivorum TaxID=1457365 RepID=A0A345UKR9_9BACT|nr:hypothetical protein [Cyclonatronum proteinivorum]AXJ01071.1 DNA topoisomerase IA [Cyclonatronum proteinivorum]
MPEHRQEIISGTLLIVESPVIAETINRLGLPQLEAIATRGYAWLPKLTPTGQLVARANPDLPEVRKELRHKAPAFTQICIACDDDPSGAFIARATAKYLGKRGGIRFGKLKGLTKESLEEMTATAVPEPADQSEQLRRHFFIRQAFKRITTIQLPLHTQLAVAILARPFETNSFVTLDESRVFRAVRPVKTDFAATFIVSRSSTSGLYTAVPKPPSTAFLPYVTGQSFAGTQERLNRLFCFQDEALSHNLISYPRTRSSAWYNENWEMLSEQFQRKYPEQICIPKAMRAVADSKSNHDALHVTRLVHTPHSLRPFLKSDLLHLYQKLYARTTEALAVPDEIHQDKVWMDESGDYFESEPVASGRSTETLKPVFALENFMQALLETGWVSPGSLGSALDGVLRSGHIILKKHPLTHPELAVHAAIQKLISGCNRTFDLMETATALKSDESLSPEQFNHRCTQLLRDGI